MAVGEPSLVLEGVEVTYRVVADRRASARVGPHRRRRRSVRALTGIDLVVHSGDRLGVVGRNGAGKSTLLRVAAGLEAATAGTVAASSRPVLLGIGPVLDPRLSGLRNVLLGCTALGMGRTEAQAAVPEILAFAGLQASADVPIRTYSTGMGARLMFAIATTVRPEILLIDETLGVGDAAFKAQAEVRLAALTDRAGTVMIVSHDLDAVTDLCTRVVWLDEGRIRMDGPSEEVVEAYGRLGS